MDNKSQADPEQWATPGLARRLTCIFYDGILVTGLVFVAIGIVVIGLDVVLGWDNVDRESLRSNPLYLTYLFSVIAGFHILFWTRGGQTLGMRSWRVKVVRLDGSSLRFRDATLRYLCAILSLLALGLGFLWVIVDKKNMAWHDHLSKTRLVLIAKRDKSPA